MEGAIVFASLIVGVAITDQLSSLHRLLKRHREVRWDALCLLVAFLILLTIVMIWWSIAGSEAESMTIGSFLPILFVLIFQFLLAAASLPDGDDPDRLDLKAYYDRKSPYIWTLYVLSSLLANGDSIVRAMMDGTDVGTLVRYYAIDFFVITVLMGSLVFVRRRWWHWVVIAVLMVGPINWLSKSLG